MGPGPRVTSAPARQGPVAGAQEEARRPEGWDRARCEQAYCALLGAELFGETGLNAAAEVAFKEARGEPAKPG